jgi:hypothetical protein
MMQSSYVFLFLLLITDNLNLHGLPFNVPWTLEFDSLNRPKKT